ncbi:MAG: hypothetical protein HY241_15550 [Actinobacteria bacterium]|nr:hypothetical protein [Actinomycetota bacterium]
MTRGSVAGPLEPDEVAVLLRAATSAPSVHNAQPWQFGVAGDLVELHLDRDRVLPAADPALREVILSCGAALAGLRLAMTHLGYQPRVTLQPDPRDADHLADVRRGAPRKPTAEQERLYAALFTRRMHRRPFADRPVRPQAVTELMRTARGHGSWAHEVRGQPERRLVADVAASSAGRLLADPAYRAELTAWTRRDRRSGDGLLLASLGEAPYPVNGVPWALLGDPSVDEESFARDVLLIVGTSTDTPRDWLVGGEALLQVLLNAVIRGLGASLLTQALEVPDSRDRLVTALRLPGPPQALLRIGHPVDVVPATTRRPLEQVLRS